MHEPTNVNGDESHCELFNRFQILEKTKIKVQEANRKRGRKQGDFQIERRKNQSRKATSSLEKKIMYGKLINPLLLRNLNKLLLVVELKQAELAQSKRFSKNKLYRNVVREPQDVLEMDNEDL
ncbi:hypothetical protein L2E82_38967 [Cichorium intybus]|uniref:Uncharacterized protein n=1 Tax=Cichorium intybus TaxID=13427 RepID=A0ACB9AHP9_CICIN|nr:hypothetical protein L2E82_38967 [Cichorium intybus]